MEIREMKAKNIGDPYAALVTINGLPQVQSGIATAPLVKMLDGSDLKRLCNVAGNCVKQAQKKYPGLEIKVQATQVIIRYVSMTMDIAMELLNWMRLLREKILPKKHRKPKGRPATENRTTRCHRAFTAC